MHKINRNIFILSVIVSIMVIVIVVGAVIEYNKNKAKLSVRLPLAQVMKMTSEFVVSGEIDRCRELAGQIVDGLDYQTVCRNNIIYEKAINNLDLGVCRQLDNTLVKVADCQRTILSEKIEKGEDISVCGALSSDEEMIQCQAIYWNRQALQNDDISVCSRILLYAQRINCEDSMHLRKFVTEPKDTACDVFSSLLKQDCELLQTILKDPANSILSCHSFNDPRVDRLCSDIMRNK